MDMITVRPSMLLELGKQGTNLTRALRFDISGWKAEYPEGSIYLLHRQPGQTVPLPVSKTEIGEGTLDWIITENDTAIVGYGQCELVLYTALGKRAKEVTFLTHIEQSVGTDSAMPEDGQSWLEQILQAATIAQTGAADAENWAKLAEQGAEASGFVFCNVNEEDGQLYMTVCDKLGEEMSFGMNEDTGELEVVIDG